MKRACLVNAQSLMVPPNMAKTGRLISMHTELILSVVRLFVCGIKDFEAI